MTSGEKGAPTPSDDSSTDQCHCGHIRFRHERDEFDDMHCSHPSCDCTEFAVKGPKAVDLGLPEPPMTPEEEEQAPEDRCTCGETACESELCDCDSAPCPVDHASEAPEDVSPEEMDRRWAKAMGDDEPPPPQPERRPPLLVAYAVQGHVYEVAVPGDATVRAVDGALVVQHHLGPVSGIVQVLPVLNEEQA